MISAFDIFKPGIGPSSSHTVGPMNAGKRFIDQLVNMGDIAHITRIVVDLYGSLSLTGKGHATDVAIVMGLAGNSPQNVDIDAMPAFIQQVMHSGRLPVAGVHERRLSDGGRHRVPRANPSVSRKRDAYYRLEWRAGVGEPDLLFGRRRFYRRRGACGEAQDAEARAL
jgi:hypothetical protein